MLYQVVLIFESVDKFLKCDYFTRWFLLFLSLWMKSSSVTIQIKEKYLHRCCLVFDILQHLICVFLLIQGNKPAY